MRKTIGSKNSAIGRYIRTRLVYTTKTGRISELSSDMNELAIILDETT